MHALRTLYSLSLMLLPVLTPAHAEIYKWVDADGRTHYSDKAVSANQAEQFSTRSEPQSQPSPESTPEYWRAQEAEFRRRRMEKKLEESARRPVVAAPHSLSGGIDDGTPEGKCKLARDVLSGAVRHSNGAPTDDYDRRVAQNDVRKYCR